VHVGDLANAHLASLDYLSSAESDTDARREITFNVGTGKGSSVFEVIEEVKKVSGIEFKEEVVSRRAGDPPYLCADVSRIKNVLGWTAKHDLHDIVASAWNATK
jgi:UDP-glucose 4-epimerase